MGRALSLVVGILAVVAGLGIMAFVGQRSEDTRPFIVGAVIVAAGFVRLMTSFSKTDVRAPRREPSADDPRWHASRGPQVAGRPCAECGRKITIERDGSPCDVCAEVAHVGCLALHRSHAHSPSGTGPFR